jgi:predicted RNase H-like HicB family nuclease/uncharacterized protein YuzE
MKITFDPEVDAMYIHFSDVKISHQQEFNEGDIILDLAIDGSVTGIEILDVTKKDGNKYIFPAIFDPCEEDGYCITFPDLPGIVTEGDTIEESLAMAKEALELHLYGMKADGEPIPEPTPPNKITVPEGGFVNLIEILLSKVIGVISYEDQGFSKDYVRKTIDFEDAALKAGGFLDTTFTTPSYRIRDMHRWAKVHGKDVEKLTTDERNQFLVDK